MIKKLFILAVFSQTFAIAHKENFYLQYLMKSLAADVKMVQAPGKTADPTEVLDASILFAIMRSRSSQFFLQTAMDARGKIVDGKFVKGEMTPGGVDEETDLVKAEQKLDLYADFLGKAKGFLKVAETQLTEQLNKNSETRDFTKVNATLTDLETTISDAHKVFRPPPPKP